MAKEDHAQESRLALAAAQKRFADAQAELAAVQGIETWEITANARGAVEAAERAVIDAARNEVDDLVAAKLGRPVPERKSRLVLHDELMAARVSLDAAQESRRQIEQRQKNANEAVQWAKSTVSAAIRDLLEAAPEVFGLLDEIKAAEARLIELYHALNAVGGTTETRTQMSARMVAKAFAGSRPNWDMLPAVDSEMVTAWRISVSALQTDANAVLPGGTAPEPKGRRKLFAAS